MMKKKHMLKPSTINNLITYGIVLIAFFVVFFLDQSGMITRQLRGLLVPVGLNIILAISLNLVVGFLGELSLGHAGFMAVGAYAGCLFSIAFADSMNAFIRFPLAILVGGLVAAVFGLLIGIPVLRLKGDYLAIVTLAFGQIIVSVILNLGFTGGASGLKGTPQDTNYIIVFALVLVTMFVVMNLVDSKHGRAICSVRDNRIAASSIGINVTYYKLFGFVLAAFFAGIAGVLYGHSLSIVQASVFDYNKSIEILVMVVLGGMCSIRGSIIAATIITVLPEVLRGADEYRMLIYSIVLVAMMILNANEKFRNFKSRLSIEAFFRNRREKKTLEKEEA